MTIDEACCAILGDEAATSITLDMGIRWTVVAAMAAAKTSDDPEALAAIRRHNAQQRHAKATPNPASNVARRRG